MQLTLAEYIKRQIIQLQAEKVNQEEIAQLSTNVLQQMLEYPLVLTPSKQYIDLYKTLVAAGGNKDVRHPKNGKTALMFAITDGRADIVKVLLALGLDPRIIDNNGNTAFKHLYGISLLSPSQKEEVNYMLYEAEIAATTQKAKTP